jgi:hypothetical protein
VTSNFAILSVGSEENVATSNCIAILSVGSEENLAVRGEFGAYIRHIISWVRGECGDIRSEENLATSQFRIICKFI